MTLPLRRQTKRSWAHGPGANFLLLTEGGTCGSLERRQINRHQLADPIVSNDGLVSQPFDERPRDSRLHRRHDVQPQRGQVRRQDRDLEDERPLSSESGDPLHHLAVGHHLRAADVVSRAERQPPGRRLLRGTRRRPRAQWAECAWKPSAGSPSRAGGRRERRSSRTRRFRGRRPSRRATSSPGRMWRPGDHPSRDGCEGEARDRRSRHRAHRGRRAVSHRRSPPPSAVVSAARRSSSSKSALPSEWTR